MRREMFSGKLYYFTIVGAGEDTRLNTLA